MRIISWNINGLRAIHKKGNWRWIVNESPDIFCLQEIKSEESQLPEEVAKVPSYYAYFNSSKKRKGYSGVAIYTKIEPLKVQYDLGVPEMDAEGRLIVLYFEDFVLLNCYFPNGGGGPERLAYKLEYYRHFLKFIQKLKKEGHNVVFCGDVNTAHTEVDLARPKENVMNTGFLPIERAWIDSVVKAGFVDVWRTMYPDAVGSYTYWDMKTFSRERNVGWRIDYFFVNKEMMTYIKKALIYKDVPGSDHCPIEIFFETEE